MNSSGEELTQRIHHGLIDSCDEELEMALEDRTVAEITGEDVLGDSLENRQYERKSRGQYFPDLF